MKLHALGEQVVIKPEEATVSKGGIIIPQTADGKSNITGIVVSVGEGTLLESGNYALLKVVPGDRVLFNKRSAAETEINGVKHLIVRSIEVLCKIEE